PSQRMAKGIQASGDRLRKKLTRGRNAARARAEWPRSRPTGTPRATARRKPAETRKSEAIESSTSRPLLSSWTRARATASGCGKGDSGKKPSAATTAHAATSARKPRRARRGVRGLEWVSVMDFDRVRPDREGRKV